MKKWLLLIVFFNSIHAHAKTANIDLPAFAIVKPVAEEMAGYQWHFQPSAYMDTYRYTHSDNTSSAEIVLRFGNDLPGLYAYTQQQLSFEHGTTEVTETTLLTQPLHFVKFRCLCHGSEVNNTLVALMNTGLTHLGKPIWMHIMVSGNDEDLPALQQWMKALVIEKNG